MATRPHWLEDQIGDFPWAAISPRCWFWAVVLATPIWGAIWGSAWLIAWCFR